jgi:hypothetical protein
MAAQSLFGSAWQAMCWPLPLVLAWLVFWWLGGRLKPMLILILKRLIRRFFYRLLIAILGVLWLALLVAYAYAYTN